MATPAGLSIGGTVTPIPAENAFTSSVNCLFLTASGVVLNARTRSVPTSRSRNSVSMGAMCGVQLLNAVLKPRGIRPGGCSGRGPGADKGGVGTVVGRPASRVTSSSK